MYHFVFAVNEVDFLGNAILLRYRLAVYILAVRTVMCVSFIAEFDVIFSLLSAVVAFTRSV